MKADAPDEEPRSHWRTWLLVSATILSLMCAIYSPVMVAWASRSSRGDLLSERASFTHVPFNWIMTKVPSLYVPLLRFHGWTQGYEATNKDGVVHGYAGRSFAMFFQSQQP